MDRLSTPSSVLLAAAAIGSLCALACGKRAYVVEDAAPAASSEAHVFLAPLIELRNDAARHVPLMLTGDGSSSGRRNPTLTFDLTPNDVAPQMGCGNMNGLSASEIVFLAPGEHAKLGWVNAPTPSKPGRYTLRATYRNDPTSKDLGDNREGPETDRLVARVRKTVPCTLVSNVVSFSWP